MKTTWDEDPSELLGIDEEEGSNEFGGSEFEDDEEDTTELMGLGDEEGYEEDDSYDEEEEDPTELYASDEEDEYEEEGEQGQESGQRIPGLRIAQGMRTRRRARQLTVAALRHRKHAKRLWQMRENPLVRPPGVGVAVQQDHGHSIGVALFDVRQARAVRQVDVFGRV